jgi:hypothetical protein
LDWRSIQLARRSVLHAVAAERRRLVAVQAEFEAWAREQVAAMRRETFEALAALEARYQATAAELAEAQSALYQLRAATLARHRAYAELAALHRERQIAVAAAAERDPVALLN